MICGFNPYSCNETINQPTKTRACGARIKARFIRRISFASNAIQTIDHYMSCLIITEITKLSTSPHRQNAMRRLIIQNLIFVKSCDQIVSSFWSHDVLFLSFGIFEFRYININITAMEGLRCGKFENYPIKIPGGSFGRKHSFVRYLKIPNDKNIKSCDQNDETIWSHDLTKIKF